MSKKRNNNTGKKEQLKKPQADLNSIHLNEHENKENKADLIFNDSSAEIIDSQKEDKNNITISNLENTETPLDESISKETSKLNSSEEENLNEADKSERNINGQFKEDNKKEQQEEIEYEVNDIVWGKVIGYPFWPGKIINILTIDPNTESTPNLKSKNKRKKINRTKDFIVQFFASPQEGHLDKKNLRPFDCSNKEEFKKKGEKDGALKKAIEDAEEAYNSKLAYDLANSRVKNGKNLMSIDEELRLINGNEANDKKDAHINKADETRLQDDTITQAKESSAKKPQRSSAVIANTNLTSSQKQKTQLQQERKKISQRHGKNFDELFELDKKNFNVVRSIALSLSQSSTETKRNNKKRSRSFDEKEQNLDDDFSENNKNNNNKNNLSLFEDKSTYQLTVATDSRSNKKRRTIAQQNKKFIDSEANLASPLKETQTLSDESRSCSPVNLSFEINETVNPIDNFYKNITLIINSKDTKNTNINFICYIIESLNENYKTNIEDRLKYTFYDVYNHKDEGKQKIKELETSLIGKLKNLNDKNFDVEFVYNLNDALKRDLVLSFVTFSNLDSKEEEVFFEENLFSSNINGVKYINLVPIDYRDILVYHYYFNHNDALFIEAPILIATSEHNLNMNNELANEHFNKEIRMYVTTLDSLHYDLIKPILESIVYKNNIFFKELEFGYPSTYVSSMQPLISNNRILSEKLFDNIKKSVIYESHKINENDNTNETSSNLRLKPKEEMYYLSLKKDNLSSMLNKILKQTRLDLVQTLDTTMKYFKKAEKIN